MRVSFGNRSENYNNIHGSGKQITTGKAQIGKSTAYYTKGGNYFLLQDRTVVSTKTKIANEVRAFYGVAKTLVRKVK